MANQTTNQTAPAAGGRLLEVDVARALAAIAVVALHAIGFSVALDHAGSAAQHVDQALIMTLRFARQVFMFISGFALAYAYRKRVVPFGGFLIKRLWRVAVPYIAWSAIYLYVNNQQVPSPTVLLQAILTGTAFYHLYYVVVSLQWYVLFLPVLACARRLGRQAAGWVSILVAGLYLGLAIWLTAGAHLPPWAPALTPLLAHRDQLLISYIGYYLLGTLGGIHAESLLGWVRRHTRLAVAVMAGLLAFLLADLVHDGPDRFAAAIDIFRPALVLYGLAGIAVILAVAGAIVRRGGRSLTWMLALSRNSYAVYLAHPLALFLTESYLLPRLGWHGPVISIPLVAIGVLVPHAAATLTARTPLAPLLLGQGSLWPWRQAAPQTVRPEKERAVRAQPVAVQS